MSVPNRVSVSRENVPQWANMQRIVLLRIPYVFKTDLIGICSIFRGYCCGDSCCTKAKQKHPAKRHLRPYESSNCFARLWY